MENGFPRAQHENNDEMRDDTQKETGRVKELKCYHDDLMDIGYCTPLCMMIERSQVRSVQLTDFMSRTDSLSYACSFCLYSELSVFI